MDAMDRQDAWAAGWVTTFAAWLTKLPGRLVVGESYDAHRMLKLLGLFMEANDMPVPVDVPAKAPDKKTVRSILDADSPNRLKVGHHDDGNVYLALGMEHPVAMDSRSAVRLAQELVKHATAAEVLRQRISPTIIKP